MKRFWKQVAVAERGILLDGRPVRTPRRAALLLPNDALADAIADEWRAVRETVDPRAMPMTALANAAIDQVDGDPGVFVATLAPYAETELLCYRADTQPDLALREAEVWDPLLAWARTRYDVAFTLASGIVHRAQPMQTVARLTAALATRSVFELAPLSPLITIGGSLVVALMLAEREIDAEAAFDATHLDELWQAELWGEDWMAADARALRRADFVAAARFLALL